jgi:hypothetical protein
LLVLTGKGERTLDRYPDMRTIPHFADLADAVNYVLLQQKKRQEEKNNA